MRRNYEICPREKHEIQNEMVSYCVNCNEECRQFAPCKGCWMEETMWQVRGWEDELEDILKRYDIAPDAAAELGELASRMVLVW
jgi:hypothetical protein